MSGAMPDWAAELLSLSWIITGIVLPRAAARRFISAAILTLSIESIQSNVSTAALALLVCRWPIKWSFIRDFNGASSPVTHLDLASCILLSPAIFMAPASMRIFTSSGLAYLVTASSSATAGPASARPQAEFILSVI